MEDPLLTLPTSSTASAFASADAYRSAPSTPRILIRIFFVAAVAAVSLWAHGEASRGFGISVVVAHPHSPPGRRFGLAFASNGRAERLVHRAGRVAARALYPDPDAFPPKPVRHVTLHVASHGLSAAADAAVGPGAGPEEYVIYLDPNLLMAAAPSAEADAAVSRAVRRGVARVFMWDAPGEVADAVAGYLASSSTAEAAPRAWSEPDGVNGSAPCWTEGFVRYWEARREGFVARLNREARTRWSERAVESALGAPLERACAAYRRHGGSLQLPESNAARSTSASRHAMSPS